MSDQRTSTQDVDDYLAKVPEPHRTTLARLRATLAGLLPDAQESITYGVPTLKVDGAGVAGFGFSKNHCTYFPMSGAITTELAERLTAYPTAKGSVQFTVDEPLPDDLVRALVEAREAEIARTVTNKR